MKRIIYAACNWKNMKINRGIKFALHSLFLVSVLSCSTELAKKPNILWITCEDISPHLGCYGEEYAFTPALDDMAAEGVLFRNAYATASVCTPARSSIITGIYASSLGTQHLRGKVSLSGNVKCFTEYLRNTGYYCANFNKTDYNFDTPSEAWDFNGSISYDSLVSGHLADIPEDRPYFCVINLALTHQSKVRYDKEELIKKNNSLPINARHDPDKVPVPPYYPNTSEVRVNLAALHTQITLMDMQVKVILDQLKEYGFDKNTIVFFYSDHGDGLPRHKRWLYHSGIQVPFIVKFPPRYTYLSPVKMGKEIKSVINFVDLAPTTLALTGCEVPERMQGKVFLGSEREERKYTVAIRDRVDEVYEFSRSISDGQFQYIRNFASNKPRMQWSNYSEITPIRKELRRLYKTNELDTLTGWLMEKTKPVEELYDIAKDPFQINNLSGSSQHKTKMEELKNELFNWMINTRDLSLVPEPLMRKLSGDRTPRDVFAENDLFPIQRVLQIADMKGRGVKYIDDLINGLNDPSPIVRYWAANGLSLLGENTQTAVKPLKKLLQDKNRIVSIAAAEALCKTTTYGDAIHILGEALLDDDIVVRVYAAIALLDMKDEAIQVIEEINESLEKKCKNIPDKYYEIYLKDALIRLKNVNM